MTPSEKNGKNGSPRATRFEKLARSRKYGNLEAEWMTIAEEKELPLDDMLAALQVLHRRRNTGQLESLLWFLLSDYAESHGAAAAMAVLLEVAPYLPTSDVLREEVADLYRKVHPENERIEAAVAMTVASGDVPLDAAVARIEKLLSLPPGRYVYDRGERRAGRIIGIDSGTRRLRVSLGGEEEKDYDAAALDDLEAAADNDLRALKVFERERLREMALNDPEALARFILETFGGRVDFKDLRGHVIDIVGSSGWGRWWSNAQALFKRSTVIQMTDERQPTLVLRRTPVSFEEQFRSRVRNAASPAARLELALDCLEHAKGGAETQPDILRFLAETLQGDVDAGRDDSPGRLAAALVVVDDIRRLLSERDEAAAGDLRDLLGDARSLPQLMRTIEDESLARRLLDFIRRELPDDWPGLYAAALPECRTGVCERIARDLVEANGIAPLAGAIEKVLARPSHHVSALIWIWRAACSGWLGKLPPPFPKLHMAEVLTNLVTAADAVKRNAQGHSPEEQKRLLAAIRGALALKDYRHTTAVIEGSDIEHMRLLLEAVERDVALTEQARGVLHHILQDKHPDLYAEHLPPWEEDVIYTTSAGLEKRRQELRVLTHEKIPANARAIGEAAAKGDLSENAEWTAAIEERDRLTERAAHIERELARARFISHQAVDGSNHVTVGSTVAARNLDTGEVDTFTFLGPWDSDIDKGILAYRSPLGLAFMGGKVGEEVTLDMGGGARRWVIEAIH